MNKDISSLPVEGKAVPPHKAASPNAQGPGDAGVPQEQAASLQGRDDVVIILGNAPDVLLAKRIAHVLVEEHYAACVNLGAVGLSMYLWEGKLEGAEEVPLLMKTSAARADALMARYKTLHPHEVPELLVLRALGGSPDYLDWVREQTGPHRPPGRHDTA